MHPSRAFDPLVRSLFPIAMLVFAGAACAGPDEIAREMAGARNIDTTLRAQGLTPGKVAPPDPFGEFGLSVSGTEGSPKFRDTRCVPPMYDAPSFSGKRFHYIA